MGLGCRAPGKITQLLDFDGAARWAAAHDGDLGHLVERGVLVQHRAEDTEGEKYCGPTALYRRNREGQRGRDCRRVGDRDPRSRGMEADGRGLRQEIWRQVVADAGVVGWKRVSH